MYCVCVTDLFNYSAMKMEQCFSETLVSTYKFMRYYNPDDQH
jgi:hypothetical protein